MLKSAYILTTNDYIFKIVDYNAIVCSQSNCLRISCVVVVVNAATKKNYACARNKKINKYLCGIYICYD